MQSCDADKNSGLYHLVEAATALSELIRSVPPEPRSVSDDDEQQPVTAPVLVATQPSSSSPVTNHTEPTVNTNNNTLPVTSNNNNSLFALATKLSVENSTSKEIFPRRLYNIISDPSHADVIAWLPHGLSFVIMRPDLLAEHILPRYFPETRNNPSASVTYKYPSFTRKLNRWGFRQVSRGPDAGAFHHKFFKRDEPDLCLSMVCQRSRRRKSDAMGQTADDVKSMNVSHHHGLLSLATVSPSLHTANHAVNTSVSSSSSTSSKRKNNETQRNMMIQRQDVDGVVQVTDSESSNSEDAKALPPKKRRMSAGRSSTEQQQQKQSSWQKNNNVAAATTNSMVIAPTPTPLLQQAVGPFSQLAAIGLSGIAQNNAHTPLPPNVTNYRPPFTDMNQHPTNMNLNTNSFLSSLQDNHINLSLTVAAAVAAQAAAASQQNASSSTNTTTTNTTCQSQQLLQQLMATITGVAPNKLCSPTTSTTNTTNNNTNNGNPYLAPLPPPPSTSSVVSSSRGEPLTSQNVVGTTTATTIATATNTTPTGTIHHHRHLIPPSMVNNNHHPSSTTTALNSSVIQSNNDVAHHRAVNAKSMLYTAFIRALNTNE